MTKVMANKEGVTNDLMYMEQVLVPHVHNAPASLKQEQEVSKAHIPLAVAIRGCNTFGEKTKLLKIS